MAISNAIRDLQFQSGDPAAILSRGSVQAGQVAQNTPVQNFNNRLMEMLKQYQQLGTRPFAEQSFNTQEAQARRVFQGPGNLAGASPTLQSQVRSADVSAIQPTISSAQASQKTFGEQISGFGDAISRAQGLVQQFELQQQNTKKEARDNINFAIESGGSAGLEALLKAQPGILKLSGFDAETIQGLIPSIKKKEDEALAAKKTVSYQDLGDRIGVFDNQGRLVRTERKGIEPGKGTGGVGLGGVLPSADDPNYFLSLLDTTKGRKAPNQVETLRPIQKSVAVINQLEGLQKSISKTQTDPILGTLRTFNPYDFDARVIQAQLQAVVPNLARGVYGEVGVLTDADIRNYIQTLPNIKSTKAQNDFVMAMTLKTVQRNLESQLETLASAGYDISGFKNQYQRMLGTVQKIEKNLGIAGVQTQGNQFIVVAPNGKRYTFPTQQAADTFKQRAGIK